MSDKNEAICHRIEIFVNPQTDPEPPAELCNLSETV
jgi:hypothetical protein